MKPSFSTLALVATIAAVTLLAITATKEHHASAACSSYSCPPGNPNCLKVVPRGQALDTGAADYCPDDWHPTGTGGHGTSALWQAAGTLGAGSGTQLESYTGTPGNPTGIGGNRTPNPVTGHSDTDANYDFRFPETGTYGSRTHPYTASDPPCSWSASWTATPTFTVAAGTPSGYGVAWNVTCTCTWQWSGWQRTGGPSAGCGETTGYSTTTTCNQACFN